MPLSQTQKVAPSMKDAVAFAKIDTDKYPSIASQHGVTALPTLVLFQGGQAVARVEGLLTAEALTSWLKKHMDAAA